VEMLKRTFKGSIGQTIETIRRGERSVSRGPIKNVFFAILKKTDCNIYTRIYRWC
jgi:hypothetical protein